MPYRAASVPLDLVITSFNGRLRALDTRTGKARWDYAPSSVLANPEICTDATRIYLFLEGTLTALALIDGQKLWSVSLGIDSAPRATRIEAHGDVVLVSVQGQLYACSTETGAVQWQARAASWMTVR